VIAVVIVTYNSAGLIRDALAALPAAFAGIPYSCVVADNDSRDRTLEIVREVAPRATIVRMGGNLGYAAGINAGITAAGPHDAVVILNPDVRLEPGSVPLLQEALDIPGVGISVPRLLDGSGALLYSLRREPTIGRAVGEALLGGMRAGRHPMLGEVVTDGRAYEHAHSVDWATGAVWCCSRTCAETVGTWDESYFLYSEETDFALRAHDLGLATYYVPEAVATHLGGESATSPALHARLAVNRSKLFRSRHGRASSAVFRGAVFLNEALRAARPTSRAALAALINRPTAIATPTRKDATR
jgi:N-acetylglucosaminyl-diphospho-decaprenol L-rhamnosyltransferase